MFPVSPSLMFPKDKMKIQTPFSKLLSLLSVLRFLGLSILSLTPLLSISYLFFTLVFRSQPLHPLFLPNLLFLTIQWLLSIQSLAFLKLCLFFVSIQFCPSLRFQKNTKKSRRVFTNFLTFCFKGKFFSLKSFYNIQPKFLKIVSLAESPIIGCCKRRTVTNSGRCEISTNLDRASRWSSCPLGKERVWISAI